MLNRGIKRIEYVLRWVRNDAVFHINKRPKWNSFVDEDKKQSVNNNKCCLLLSRYCVVNITMASEESGESVDFEDVGGR